MMVLHINRNYLTTALHQTMIEHLEKMGVSCAVFAPSAKEEKPVITPNANVTKCVCYSKWERPFYRLKQSKIINRIQKVYDFSTFDIVHASTVFTDGNCARVINKRYGIPYIVAVRDTDLTFFKIRFDLRKRGIAILNEASAVIFLSEGHMNKLFDNFIPENMRKSIKDKAYVIPNGIDDFWLNNKLESKRQDSIDRISNKEIRIIYAGRITQNKNLELTQKALELLRKQGWKCSYTFVGKVYDTLAYDNAKNYPDSFYIDQKSKEQLISFYRESDIFVMPSHHETFGLVYAEAMSQGLPVIYTRGQGFDGQFEEGIVGYSVSDNDAVELRDRIIQIADDYTQISANACSLADRFKWSRICDKYVDLYDSVI